jgi:hypothetical protein
VKLSGYLPLGPQATTAKKGKMKSMIFAGLLLAGCGLTLLNWYVRQKPDPEPEPVAEKQEEKREKQVEKVERKAEKATPLPKAQPPDVPVVEKIPEKGPVSNWGHQVNGWRGAGR